MDMLSKLHSNKSGTGMGTGVGMGIEMNMDHSLGNIKQGNVIYIKNGILYRQPVSDFSYKKYTGLFSNQDGELAGTIEGDDPNFRIKMSTVYQIEGEDGSVMYTNEDVFNEASDPEIHDEPPPFENKNSGSAFDGAVTFVENGTLYTRSKGVEILRYSTESSFGEPTLDGVQATEDGGTDFTHKMADIYKIERLKRGMAGSDEWITVYVNDELLEQVSNPDQPIDIGSGTKVFGQYIAGRKKKRTSKRKNTNRRKTHKKLKRKRSSKRR
jgi:hypothetical protein